MSVGKRAVAFLDILGFKQMLDSMPLEELSKKYETVIQTTEILNKDLTRKEGEFPSLFPNHPQGARWCIKNVFSDSIILVSEDDNRESVLKLLVYTWRLTQMFMGMGMPVRGGISFGEFYINENSNVFLGEALTNAYLLESKQQWAGVSIDNSLFDGFPELKECFNNPTDIMSLVFPKYLVPLKGGEKETYHVVNWRLNLVSEKGTKAFFKDSENADANEKIKNTLEFARHIKDGGQVYAYGEGVPIELRTFYFGNQEPPFKHGDEF